MINFKDVRVQLLSTSILLALIGLVFIYSTGSVQAMRLERTETYFFLRQFAHVIIGLGAMIVAYNIPLSLYRRLVVPIYFFTLVLLFIVLFMPEINGASRWLKLGPVTFQPSEMAKFTAILYLAHYFDKKSDRVGELFKGIMPATIMVGILAAFIILEPDFGTTFIIVVVACGMFIVGGARPMYFFGLLGIVIPVLASALLFGYRKGRVLSFLDPWGDRYGVGYQLIQSLAAVGSGGFFGKGVGNSTQKLFFLPEAHTDFIYAIIAEETGLIGAGAIFLLVVFFFKKTLDIALAQEDKYRKLLVVGIGLTIFIQSVIHVFVTLGLAPTKGLTLPFVSYGGSAMLINMFFLGVILRAANEVPEKLRERQA